MKQQNIKTSFGNMLNLIKIKVNIIYQNILLLIIISVLFTIVNIVYAQNIGGQPAQFLQWGAGARAFGLGGAFFSVCDDASATYWNPAGMTQLERKEFMALHAELFPGTDTTYDFLSFVYPTARYGVLGTNYTRLYSGGFQKIKIVQTPEGIVDFQDEGTFDNINSAITVSYGKKVVSNTSVGIAAKIVTRKLDTEQDTMITGDLSLLMTGVKQNLPNLNLAFGIRNLIHMEFNTDDKLPLILKFGVSNKFLKNRLNCAFDFEKNLSAYGGDFGKNLAATPNWAIGLEYWVVNFAALRVGFNGEKEIRESNIGIGLKTTVEEWGDYGLDLAFAMHELGQSFRLSGTWRFGKSYIQNRDATVKRLMQEAIEIVRRGNFLLAYSKFEQAFNVDPTNKDISNSMTRLQEIISFINRATANTEEENAIRKGASSYVESDIQNAINSFRYAYYKNPQNTKLLNLLNQLEKKAGLPVTEAYREEIVGFTMIDKKIYDARQAVMQGKYDEALIRCQEILNLEPKNTTAMEIMGSVFFMMNRPDKAREVWMKVLEIDPTNKIVQQFLNELK